MTALLVIGMTAPLWLGFGAIVWQLIRLTRRLGGSSRQAPEVNITATHDLTPEQAAMVTDHLRAAIRQGEQHRTTRFL